MRSERIAGFMAIIDGDLAEARTVSDEVRHLGDQQSPAEWLGCVAKAADAAARLNSLASSRYLPTEIRLAARCAWREATGILAAIQIHDIAEDESSTRALANHQVSPFDDHDDTRP